MEFATKQDNVKKIDASAKNKWRWDWIDDEVMGQHIKKLKISGQAFCTLCNKILQYQSGGKRDLQRHVTGPTHLKAMETVKTNYSLEGFLIAPKQAPAAKPVIRPAVPFNDRKFNMEAMLLGFMAEKDLPYSLSSDLISLSQAMAKDIKVLNELSMDRTTASYKMEHGVAKFFQDSLDRQLQSTFFSLNLDESTSSNLEKIVAVLVSYYSSEEKQIVVRHLESFKIIKADSASLFQSVCNMFEKHNLPWENLVSVLLDSCNTMRGKKSGLETRLREKASHLLDIDGDAVHHAHNAAKAFAVPFEHFIEGLFSDIHTDFQWSSDLRESLETICEILNIKYTMPERFLSHRFLSAHKLAVDTQRLLDAYTVMYYSFILDKKEMEKHRPVFLEILNRKGVSENSLEKIQSLRAQLRKKNMTKDGQARKERINDKLFSERRKMKMLLGIYASVLEVLKEYTVLFQRKEPMIHVLHDEQTRLLREFFSYFIKPEKLPQSAKKLQSLNLKDEALWLQPRDMFMGSAAKRIMAKTSAKDRVVGDVTQRLKMAFAKCGELLIKKMPVNNHLLKNLSAIDPCARGHSLTLKYLQALPAKMTNILTAEEEEAYDKEIHKFNCDPTLPQFEEDMRVDHWWTAVEGYPCLQKVALAALTCFHGPLVEGCFNLMGDVLDAKSSRMSVSSLNAIQTVKSHLKTESSLKYFSRENILFDPVKPGLVHSMINARKEKKQCLQQKRLEKEERKEKLEISKRTVVSKRAASEMASRAVKKARLEHLSKSKKC